MTAVGHARLPTLHIGSCRVAMKINGLPLTSRSQGTNKMNNKTTRLIGTVLFSTLVALAGSAYGALPAGTTQNSETGHYYVVIESGNITWTAANAAANALPCLLPDGSEDMTCEAPGTVAPHLATITSSREEAFVDGLRDTTLMGEGGPAQTWIGGFQDPAGAEPGEGWQWVNGEGAFPGANGGTVYTNWNAAEPNNSGNEDHLALGRYGLGLGWNDELETRTSIRGYIVEWDVPLPAADCEVSSQNPMGCTTIVGQTISLPEGSVPAGATISFNSFEFLDPRVDNNPLSADFGKCVLRQQLTIFGNTGIGSPNVPVNDPAYRPPMIIPAYLCGSPRFVVVAIDSGDLVIETGTVGVENDTATVLPGNVYPDGGVSVCEDPIVQVPYTDGDPQYQDISTWQDTLIPTKMVEQVLGGVNGFPGLTGEFADECGSSKMRVRGASYFGIGFHIDFGKGYEWAVDPDANFSSFVALTRYKLVLLEQSVKDARTAGATGWLTNALLRFNVARAIRRLDQSRYTSSFLYTSVALWIAENFPYTNVPGENFNGDHVMRASNAKFMLRVKIIPYEL